MQLLRKLSKQIGQLQQAFQTKRPNNPFAKYAGRPVEYAHEVLGIKPWSVQIEAAEALMKPPYMVWVRSCHNVGKTHLAAWLTNYKYDVYDNSCAVLTTAPTYRDVKDVLWREIRVMRQRAGLGGFIGPKVPELYDHADHYAKGFPGANFFVGRHVRFMLWLLDEAPGIESGILTQIFTMFQPTGDMGILAIGNPVDTSSQMFAEENMVTLTGEPKWTTISMSAIDHPNIQNELRGEPVLIPNAVNLGQFNQWLADWSDPILPEEADATDLEWPPDSGNWYRPGPEMEARALGRWPSASVFGIWSDAAWQAALVPQPVPVFTLPEIGCDVARFGNDYTEIIVRVGPCVMHHERHNGWTGPKIVGRLKELEIEWSRWYNAQLDRNQEPTPIRAVRVKVDEDGMGGLGVVDWANPAWRKDFNFIGISAASKAFDEERYANRRSEMWFHTVMLARTRRLDLSRLSKETLARLRMQCMAPLWDFQGARRFVEPKKNMKERLPALGSPDGMDALNICFAPVSDSGITTVQVQERAEPLQKIRKLFGRRE